MTHKVSLAGKTFLNGNLVFYGRKNLHLRSGKAIGRTSLIEKPKRNPR